MLERRIYFISPFKYKLLKQNIYFFGGSKTIRPTLINMFNIKNNEHAIKLMNKIIRKYKFRDRDKLTILQMYGEKFLRDSLINKGWKLKETNKYIDKLKSSD